MTQEFMAFEISPQQTSGGLLPGRKGTNNPNPPQLVLMQGFLTPQTLPSKLIVKGTAINCTHTDPMLAQ